MVGHVSRRRTPDHVPVMRPERGFGAQSPKRAHANRTQVPSKGQQLSAEVTKRCDPKFTHVDAYCSSREDLRPLTQPPKLSHVTSCIHSRGLLQAYDLHKYFDV